MKESFFEKFSAEKSLIYALITAVLLVFVFILYLFFSYGVNSVQLKSPNGGEEWEIGQTYQIDWKAKGMEKVGIVLFNEKEAKWIAKNINAKAGKYDWKIYPGQKCSDGYWIAVFEYPWRQGNKISYSNRAFAITYSKFFSCDDLSTENEWPYIPGDLPNLRKVFITKNSYTGNLDGLEGADNKCQEEAKNQGFEGKWHAFLGGDGDEETAIKRMEKTPRETEGVFIEAKASANLTRGVTCHRLLGKNFSEFLAKFSNSLLINKEKLNEEFLNNLSDIWLGRVDDKSKKNCISILSTTANTYAPLAEKYTFTTTCQNWIQESSLVSGYPVPKGEPNPSFSTCYTLAGKFTNAVALGGLSSGLTGGGDDAVNYFTPYQGKYCDTKQKLLCIEE